MNEKNNIFKTVSIVIFLSALAVFFLLKVIPVFFSLIVSVSDYKPVTGLFGSPYIGLRAYEQFFNSAYFSRLLGNTLFLSLGVTVLSVITALPVSIIAGNMEKGKRRSILLAVLLLPAFIPDLLIAIPVIWLGGSKLLSSNIYFRFVYIILASIKTASIFSFTGAAAAAAYRDSSRSAARGAASGIAAAAVVNIVCFLTTNRDLLMLLYNPLVYQTTDTLDTYIFRTGIMNAQFTATTAIWLFKTILQIISSLITALIFKAVFFKENNRELKYKSNGSSAGYITGAFAIAIFVILLSLSFFTGGSSNDSYAGSAMFNSIIITLISTFIFVILFAALTTGFYKNFNTATIILILLLSSFANNIMGEYLFFRSLGLFNTHIASILSNIFNFSFVFITAWLIRVKKPDAKASDFIRIALPYLILFTGVFAANTWGSYGAQQIYISNRNLYGIAMIVREQIMQGTSDTGLVLFLIVPILIIAVVSVSLFAMLENRE